MNKNKYLCKICKQYFLTTRKLSYHIRKNHNISPKEYYDLYMKKINEEICERIECNHICKFLDLQKGYTRHCSCKCSTLNKKTQNKMKNTMLKKYGVEHALQSEIIFSNMKNNNIKKYGKENVQQVSKIRKKSEETNFKKYGNKYIFCIKSVKDKIHQSMTEYGVYNNNRKKSKQTCLRRYGVKNISQLEEVKDKKKQTCLKNNGYEYWVGTDEHKDWMNNGGAAYCNQFIKNPSKPQVELFKLCQGLLPYPVMNYPCDRYSIDIAVPSLNLAIEYDGSYWHQDKNYDNERQEQIEKEGWLFLRYIDEVPSEKKLIKDIGELLC